MPSRTTRSGRVVKNSSTAQSKLDALEILERQRRGEKIDTVVKEDEPLFEEVVEDDYKRTRKAGFIVDNEDDSYGDESDLDFIDDEFEEDEDRSDRNKKTSKKRGREREHDPKQRSMKSFLGAKGASSKSKGIHVPSLSSSTKQPEVNQDDILSQMLFDVPVKKSISTSKPLKISRLPPSTPNSSSLKSTKLLEKFEPSPKRPRMVSPVPDAQPPSPVCEYNPASPLPDVDMPSSPFSEADTQSQAHETNLSASDSNQNQLFYWYDCCEDQVKNPDDSNYDQAVGEFTHITAKKLKIKNFTCEKVTKKYAFSSDARVPLVGEYVKVQYPATQTIPPTLVGDTFSCVLNSSQSPMEKLILDLGLRGPCWLRVVDPKVPDTQLTWTKVELVLETPQDLLVEKDPELKSPYFCTFSLSLRTYKNPVSNSNEIIAIAGMVNTAFNLDECLKSTNKASGHFCLIKKPPAGHKELKLPYDFQIMMKKYTKTRLELVENERDLLEAFLEKFTTYDPDIVVGHDLLNFDYETLVMRMRSCKLGTWSKLGRFHRKDPASTKSAFRYMFSGRVMCDIRLSAMELIHARSYDLTELISQVLKKPRTEYHHAAIVEAFRTSERLLNLIQATWEDVDSIFSILVELNIMPLALKITNITGNILSRTLAAGRSERNEYLLLHAFHEDNFICPPKLEKKNTTQKRKAAYSGGLVLEPKTGYYDSCILLMDFNSLYPSIIQEFNICFSTVSVPEKIDTDPDAEIVATLPDDSIPTGVLPTQLKNLVERRRKVKRLMAEAKTPDAKMILDIEQKALKLTANSMYGCLGFEYSRFYAKHLASLVTFKGREILMSTKALVEKLGYEVIYGDTDSLMINTKISNYDDVISQGNSIKGEVNRTFKLLEIDIDGIYKPLLLLKKKNYAGVSIKKLPNDQIVKVTETKGLDTVRRDRAVIAKEAGEKVLSMILSAEKEIDQVVEDIHNYLKELGASVSNGSTPVEKFLISKQLNRNPEEYRETKGLGHIALALRYNQDVKRTRKMKLGDTVEYVVCLNNTTDSANQRAYTLEELAENPELKLDYEYYLCQQIHPVMTRICEKLPVTNAYILAEMLGIEKSSMLHIKRDDTDGVKRDQLISKGAARFNSCRPLTIVCPNCNLPTEVSDRTSKGKNNKLQLSLTNCPECQYRYASRSKLIVAQIIALIRNLTLELFTSKYICENPECENQTRNVFGPLTTDNVSESSTNKTQPLCELCYSPMLAEMDDRKMDLQLGFIRHLFDVQREHAMNPDLQQETRDDVLEMYGMCFKEADYALRCSLLNNIDGYTMFKPICSRA